MSYKNPELVPLNDYKLELFFEGFVAGIMEETTPAKALATRSYCLQKKREVSQVNQMLYSLLTNTLQQNFRNNWAWDKEYYIIAQFFFNTYKLLVEIDQTCHLSTYFKHLAGIQFYWKSFELFYG